MHAYLICPDQAGAPVEKVVKESKKAPHHRAVCDGIVATKSV